MKQYLNLIRAIQEKGTYKAPARANMPGTTSLFGHQFRHNLSDGFPALTTKKLYWKGVVVELLWFLRGDTNIKFLDERGVKKMWHQDAYNYYCSIACANNSEVDSILRHNGYDNVNPAMNGTVGMYTFEEFCKIINSHSFHSLPTYKNYKMGDCGYQYGKVWRAWDGLHYVGQGHEMNIDGSETDQIVKLIKGLINSPEGRRHVVTAWDPAHDKELALTWCHALFQFNCRPMDNITRAHWAVDNRKIHRRELMFDILENPDRTLEKQLNDHGIPKYYLDCQLYQRSADVFLGVPLNIASYALLTEILCKICGMVPGEFIHTFGDVHIYDNHKEAIAAQLDRDVKNLPILQFGPGFEMAFDNYNSHGNFDDFINYLDYNDFSLSNYDPHSTIQADLSTGMK